MAAKRKIGRPKGSTKLTKAIVAALRQSLLDGETIKSACAKAGVSYSSYYRWRQLGKVKRNGIYRAFHQAINPIFQDKERRWLAFCAAETETAFARLEKKNERLQRDLQELQKRYRR
ncbi:MAG: transposase [Desulfofustis sp.]|nr:transposase [Desulfofustis sp.]